MITSESIFMSEDDIRDNNSLDDSDIILHKSSNVVIQGYFFIRLFSFVKNDNNLISTPNGVNYLHYGDSLQLSNTVDTTKFSIDWESSDGNLAIVDNNGLVVSRTNKLEPCQKKPVWLI